MDDTFHTGEEGAAGTSPGTGPCAAVSDRADDPDWDAFLERTPGGDFVQASCWGRVRALSGWRVLRLVVRDGTRIVGGAQMEIRPMPALGNLAFVRRGPVVEPGREDVTALVLDRMMSAARADRVGYLVVQPPRGSRATQDALVRRGFRDGPFDIDLEATVIVEDGDADTMFAALQSKCRQHVRYGIKHGVTVREGSAEDLGVFTRLKDVQSARLGFIGRDGAFYSGMWDALAPGGHIRLFVAEHGGEALAALLVVAFGDTVHHLERPWSGERGDLKPNEVLEWEVLKWAGAHGYRRSDLFGLSRHFAMPIVSGLGVPDDPEYSSYRFKLKFGGEVVMCARPYHRLMDPALNLAFRGIPSPVMQSRWMDRLASRFRAGTS